MKALGLVAAIRLRSEQKLTQVQAGTLPGQTPRHIRRLLERVAQAGDQGLVDVSTLDAANQFLAGYLPIQNRRFTVQPAQAADLPRPRPAQRELNRILCLKTFRGLRRDCTVVHQGGLYQIHDMVQAPHALVEERIDGILRITHQGRTLGIHAIASRPMKAAEDKKVPRPRHTNTPRPKHKNGQCYVGRKRRLLFRLDISQLNPLTGSAPPVILAPAIVAAPIFN